MQANIDFNDQVYATACSDCGYSELPDASLAINGHGERAESGDPGGFGSLGRANYLVCHEHVTQPGINHRCGFPYCRRRESDGAGFQLQLAERGALMDLCVRAKCCR